MDVKSAFLNRPLEEEAFVKQPPGFMKKGSEEKVYKLKSHLWFETSTKSMEQAH